MMSNRKIRLMSFGAALLLVIVFVGHTISVKLASRKCDAARLASFAHQIAGTDRIVGTFRNFDDSKVILTITGDDVGKVVRAVASASSDRPGGGMIYDGTYPVTAVFYKGTNDLGNIEIGEFIEGIFLIDTNEDLPLKDSTKLLRDLVMIPARKAYEKNDQIAQPIPGAIHR
jgi:hypothetical protein